MVDAWLITRPDKGKGWTEWEDGVGDRQIETVWWQAKILHFPKDNVTHWYDGSDLVGIAKWGYHGDRYCMRRKPKGWKPEPAGHRAAAERIWQAWRAEQARKGAGPAVGHAQAIPRRGA